MNHVYYEEMIRDRSPSASGRKRRIAFRLQPPTITDDMDEARRKRALQDQEILEVEFKVKQKRGNNTMLKMIIIS